MPHHKLRQYLVGDPIPATLRMSTIFAPGIQPVLDSLVPRAGSLSPAG